MCTWKLSMNILSYFIHALQFNLWNILFKYINTNTWIGLNSRPYAYICSLHATSDFMDQHNHEKTKVWCSMNNLSFNLQCNSYTEQRYWLHFTELRFLRSYFPLSRTASSKLFSLIAFCTACVWNEREFHFIIFIVQSRH